MPRVVVSVHLPICYTMFVSAVFLILLNMFNSKGDLWTIWQKTCWQLQFGIRSFWTTSGAVDGQVTVRPEPGGCVEVSEPSKGSLRDLKASSWCLATPAYSGSLLAKPFQQQLMFACSCPLQAIPETQPNILEGVFTSKYPQPFGLQIYTPTH